LAKPVPFTPGIEKSGFTECLLNVSKIWGIVEQCQQIRMIGIGQSG
jgi:hypothetical protein